MRLKLLVCLSFVAIVCAQTPQAPSQSPTPAAPATEAPSGAPAQPAAPEPPKVNPDDPVITIKGLCADSSLQGDACKTVITKAEFEKMTEQIQPNMAPPMRRQFATRYAQVLNMSSQAEKRGLEKSPDFEQKMRLARMQILSQELTKALQADASNISDQDIQDYYQKNLPSYEQATFVKIFVPHSKREEPAPPTAKKTGASKTSGSTSQKTAPPVKKAKDPSDTSSAKTTTDTTKKTASGTTKKAASKAPEKKLTPEEQEQARVEAMTKEAKLLRERLVQGEDPDKLEKEAFAAAGLPGNPPPTRMEKVRRSTLPADQQSVMDLKPGEVSDVISNASGNYIYKLVSKETLPVDAVKTEIKNQLSGQRYREAMGKFQGATEFNDAYFGRAPGMPPAPGRPGMPPGAPPDKDKDRD